MALTEQGHAIGRMRLCAVTLGMNVFAERERRVHVHARVRVDALRSVVHVDAPGLIVAVNDLAPGFRT